MVWKGTLGNAAQTLGDERDRKRGEGKQKEARKEETRKTAWVRPGDVCFSCKHYHNTQIRRYVG